MAVTSSTPIELVRGVYDRLAERVALGRRHLGRPLTFTEKVLLNHLRSPGDAGLDRGVSYTDFDPDRVAMQDATAQMALLQFMTAGLDEAAVPATVHCDHLILAKAGADLDLRFALDSNSEVYEFLRSVAARYGIGFWKPGSGIIHQVVLENYAFPGGMMIGTDSHTPNAGGLGMVAIGVGGADAVDAVAADLRHDPEVEADPERFFDRLIEIDLSTLEPLINGPDSPDLAHTVSEVGGWAREHGVPAEVASALIGSCTNSSYEDITRAASIARQAAASGLRAKTQLLITPGSEQVRATIERDGLLADLQAIGGEVLANACGPCIGQWERTDLDASKVNTIVNSYNRNFPKRNDGSGNTRAFVTSPDMVIAYALSGTLDFNPLTDAVDGVTLDPPVGERLPGRGFDPGESGFLAPPADGGDVEVVVSPDSERLQLLEPFPAWDGHDYERLPVLLKYKDKSTTDPI